MKPSTALISVLLCLGLLPATPGMAAAPAPPPPPPAAPDDARQSADATLARAAATAEMDKAREQLEQAREQLARAAEQLARLSEAQAIDSPGAYAFEFLANPDRAMLGVTISDSGKDGHQGDTKRGVLISGVTPGSGADKAGLESGDLLLSANGETLAATTADPKGPVHKLRDIMGALRPGDPVAIEYERKGKRAHTEVIASRPHEAFGAMSTFLKSGDHDIELLLPPSAPLAPAPCGAPLPGVQLVGMNDDLADYFDTDGGVLVVAAPAGKALPKGTLELKGGDVIRAVNGRKVEHPIDAWDALSGADGTTRLRVTVIRHGTERTLEGTVPPSLAPDVERRIIIEHRQP